MLQTGFISGSCFDDKGLTCKELCSQEIALVRPYAGGWGMCLAATAHGRTYSWGINQPVLAQSLAESQEPFLLASDVDDAAAGFDYCLLVRNGQLWMCQPSPSKPFDPPLLNQIQLPFQVHRVAVGEQHSLILTANGDVYAFGSNSDGQLGVHNVDASSTPVLVMGPSSATTNCQATGIAAGGRHSVAITTEGRCFAWGWGLHGQCGNGQVIPTIPTPHLIESLGPLRCIHIAAGLAHTLCCTDQGDVYAWGMNTDFQLGEGSGVCSAGPVLVEGPGLDTETVVKVAAGARHSLALCSSGKVYGWGHAAMGQLGAGATQSTAQPFQVVLPRKSRAVDIAAGWWHTLISTN